MEQNSIVVKNVTKKFDDFMLDHISFTVPTGRIVGFIGENGAGKSTTINLILYHLKVHAGEIGFFNDTAPTEFYTLSLHDALPIYLY